MRKVFALAAVSAAMLAGFASTAHARLILSMGDGVNNVSCDNGTAAGVAACGLAGFTTSLNSTSIVLASPINLGTWSVGGALTSTSSNINSTALNQTTLTVSQSNAAGGFFFVDLQVVGVTLPPGPILSLFGSSGGSANAGATGSVVNKYIAYPGNENELVPAPTEISCGYALSTSFNCSAIPADWTRLATPFKLKQVQEFTVTSAISNFNTTNNLIVSKVPEPLTAGLVGLGLLALGATARRRRSV